MLDMNALIGRADLALITLDTLRYDVAQRLHTDGLTPHLSALLGPEGWQRRHSPGSFTYAAHHAFFAGFLPTPAIPGRHPRLFAASFGGSETTSPDTFVFEQADLIAALRARGYHTICIGGVGFFNMQTAVGCVLPGLFDEAHWSPELGVTDPRSTEHQVALASARLAQIAPTQRVMLFINVSAIHQPNRHYLPGATQDSIESHAAAMIYVDRSLAPLWRALGARPEVFAVVCADHGSAYGEDGFMGHRIGLPVVMDVPYAELHFAGAADAPDDAPDDAPSRGAR